MIRAKVWVPIATEERWLNKKAERGYELDSINSFVLLPPLELRVYIFKKTKHDYLY